MKFNRDSSITAYFLVAAIICLVVNFSYLLLLVVNQDDSYSRNTGRKRSVDLVMQNEAGRLSLSIDGFGYIVTESGDSIYVDRGAVRQARTERRRRA